MKFLRVQPHETQRKHSSNDQHPPIVQVQEHPLAFINASANDGRTLKGVEQAVGLV